MDAHPPADARDDNTLARLAAVQPRAFAALYRRHVHRIYRYALARTGNTADAEDLTAQTFTAALHGIAHYRGEGSVAAWLTSIARNLSASALRNHVPNLPLDENIAAPDHSPEEIASRRLSLETVLDALDALPADHAEVVRLRIFSALSTAETAELLGKSEAAVKMTLHRALQALRRRVEASEQETRER